jgi:flagellar biosynthetic protein FliO
MQPLVETLASTGPVAPSPLAAAARMFAVLLLFAICAWVFLRYRNRQRPDSTRIRVLDRAFLNRGVGVTLVSVEGRRLLLGISGEGITLLTDLESHGAAKQAKAFPDLLAEAGEAASKGEGSRA